MVMPKYKKKIKKKPVSSDLRKKKTSAKCAESLKI